MGLEDETAFACAQRLGNHLEREEKMHGAPVAPVPFPLSATEPRLRWPSEDTVQEACSTTSVARGLPEVTRGGGERDRLGAVDRKGLDTEI